MLGASMRIEKAYGLMRASEVDALLLFNPKSIYYFAGFLKPLLGEDSALFIPLDGEPVLVVPRYEFDRAAESSWIKDVRYYSTYPVKIEGGKSRGIFDVLREVFAEKDMLDRRVGVELQDIKASFFEGLKREMPKMGFKDISDTLWRLRSIKDIAEIDNIRKAAEIAEKGLRTALELISPGISEIEATSEVKGVLMMAGSQEGEGESKVVSGERSAYPYASPSSKKIGENEIVTVVVSANYNGYYARLSRTLYTGKPKDKHKEIFETVKRAFLSAVKELKPGEELSKVDQAARKVIKEGGYEEFFIYPTGSGVGLSIEEPPVISLNNNEPIRAGMVFSIKPAVYIPRFGGVRIENTVVVDEEGGKSLVRIPLETM
ncbi:MAG: Xaa-Pro peptidase family protein [Candidatus Jordarchaeales archaeon]